MRDAKLDLPLATAPLLTPPYPCGVPATKPTRANTRAQGSCFIVKPRHNNVVFLQPAGFIKRYTNKRPLAKNLITANPRWSACLRRLCFPHSKWRTLALAW